MQCTNKATNDTIMAPKKPLLYKSFCHGTCLPFSSEGSKVVTLVHCNELSGARPKRLVRDKQPADNKAEGSITTKTTRRPNSEQQWLGQAKGQREAPY